MSEEVNKPEDDNTNSRYKDKGPNKDNRQKRIRSRGRTNLRPMSEINVTPFVDVMLVLLIIFMVTAPLLTVGVQVDLPESSADTLPEETEPLTLTINSKGEIFIQETKVEYEKIIAKILAVSNNRTDTRIFVRGDKTINYGRVLEIMGMLSGSGFTKVALISEPYKER